MACLASISYVMTADVYTYTMTQDITGVPVKTWTFNKTVVCNVRNIIATGKSTNSAFLEVNKINNAIVQMVKLKCSEKFDENVRLTNIRNRNGDLLFAEYQDLSGNDGVAGATIFEPRGSLALFNYNGKIIEYETTLMRQEVQKL